MATEEAPNARRRLETLLIRSVVCKNRRLMHTSADDTESAASIAGPAEPVVDVHQESKSFADDRRALADTKIEALRRKLLDLSLANRLVSFRHSDTSRTHIRIVDELPKVVLSKLQDSDRQTYGSSRSVRDRDRLRQKILEDRGWRLHRVWSTDWFRNLEHDFKRLIDRIRALRTTGRVVGNGL